MKFLALIVLALALGGCVSKSQYRLDMKTIEGNFQAQRKLNCSLADILGIGMTGCDEYKKERTK